MINNLKQFEVPTEMLNEVKSNNSIPSIAQVEEILGGVSDSCLGIEKINLLLNAINSDEFKEIESLVLQKSTEIRQKYFKNDVYFMSPIEVSNYCASDCIFCGWRKTNKFMNRLRLSDRLVLEQVKYLIDKGIYIIELVGGDDIYFVKNQLPGLVREAKKLFPPGVNGQIYICTMALTEDQYKNLHDAGADGVVTWQETYDSALYNESILAGPKASRIDENFTIGSEKDGFQFRLNSQERAIRAGLKIALGTIIGFNPDYKFEILSTILHANYMAANFHVDETNPIVIGMPTWNNLTIKEADNKPKNLPSVEPYFAFISALYLLGSPFGKVWVFPACRVSLKTQIKSILAAGVFTSTEVKISPGGYLASAIQNMDQDKRDSILSELKAAAPHLFEGDNFTSGLDKMEQFVHYYMPHEDYIAEFRKHGLNV